jgi:hypothetical protein
LVIEVEEIEGKEHDAVRSFMDARAQSVEVGDAVLVLDDDLAVDQRRLSGEAGACIQHPVIGPCPVPAMP